MGCTLGRITGLESPKTIRQEGDRLRLAGEFAPTSVEEGVALAQQVVGYPSPDEEVVPFTYDAAGAGGVLDGFYFVVSTQVDWAKLAAGVFSWEAELVAVPGKQAPLFEVNSIGADRSSVHSVTEWSWVGAPLGVASGGQRTSDSLGSFSDFTISNKLGPTGDSASIFYSAAAKTVLYADELIYGITPASFYDGAARIEYSTDAGATWQLVTGRQIPLASLGTDDRIRLAVGFMRFLIAPTGTLTYSTYDLPGAETWQSKNVKATVSATPFTLTPDGPIAVLRNSAECCTVRVWTTNYIGTLDFTVRRGSWVVEMQSNSYQATRQFGVFLTSNEAGTNVTGGIDATSADADGNKYQLRSPNAITTDTTKGGLYLTSAARSGSFAIATDNKDGNGTTAPDTTGIYFAAMSHRQQVVAR